ncbi:MAG: hypothetical protein AAGI66_07095 [Cyanobacteria bacterium P01_H01_bin.74]
MRQGRNSRGNARQGGSQRPTEPAVGNGKRAPQNIERQLGLQYAAVLQNSQKAPDVYKDAKQVIDASLAIMGFCNRVAFEFKNNLKSSKADNQSDPEQPNSTQEKRFY